MYISKKDLLLKGRLSFYQALLILACVLFTMIPHFIQAIGPMKYNVTSIVRRFSRTGYGYPLPQVGLTPLFVIETHDGVYYSETYEPSIKYMQSYTSAVQLIAGNGVAGYSGDGGLATIASIGNVPSIAFHPITNELYFSDSTYNVIRKIDVNGTINTYCGLSNMGGSQASKSSQLCAKAYFKSLKGMKFDSEGNLYIVSSDRHVIYKIDVNGTNAEVFVGKLDDSKSFAENVLPTQTSLNTPSDLYIATNGDMYIADSQNHIIRVINASTGNITTFAGTKGLSASSSDGTVVSKLSNPTSLLLNKDGTKLYVADYGNYRIKSINLSDKKGKIVVGGGNLNPIHGQYILGTSILMNSGVSYISASPNYDDILTFGFGNSIKKLFLNGTVANYGNSQFFNSDGAYKNNAYFSSILSFLTNSTSDELIIADGNRVRKIDSDGLISTIAGSATDGNIYDVSATSARMSLIRKMVRLSNGNIMFSDNGNNMLKILTEDGKVKLFAGTISSFKGSENAIASSSFLNNPSSLFMNSKGELLIADTEFHRVRKIDVNGIINTIMGTGDGGFSDNANPLKAQFNRPVAVIEYNSVIYVADRDNQKIRKLENGAVSTFAGGGSDEITNNLLQLRIQRPSGLAVYNNSLFFSDRDSKLIRSISLSDGTVSIYAGCSQTDVECPNNKNEVDLATMMPLNAPESIFILSNGDMLIAETGDWTMIKRVNASSGLMYTVAGRQFASYYNPSDDGKPASSASISTPKGFAYDSNTGDIYLAEQQAIRKISPDGIISKVLNVNSALSIAFNSITNELFYAEGNYLNKYVNNTKTVIVGGTGDLAPATQTILRSPSKFVVNDDMEVYLVERDTNRVRKINKDGIIDRFAGTGDCPNYSNGPGDGNTALNAKICSPIDIQINSQGDVFVLEDDTTTYKRLRKILANGTVSTIAGGQFAEKDYGKAVESSIGFDIQSFVHLNGSFFISTTSKIKRIDQRGNIYTIAGKTDGKTTDGPALEEKVNMPILYVSDNGDLYYSEQNEGTIKQLIPYCPDGAEELDDLSCLYSCNGSTDATGCSSHGECIGTDTCYCNSGYTGQFCQDIMCYDRKSSAPDVCSGHGDCIGANNCSCRIGYTGNNCENRYCFGILNTDGRACSQHGSCESYDKCNCNYGYTEPDCSVYTCNGIKFNASNVCSGNGVCTNYEFCQCSQGYNGQFCQDYTCFGVQSTDQKQVCSSRGTCTKIDTCQCDKGYFGEKCQYTTCFDIPNNSSNVCNGRGTCDSYDGCQCSQGYSGESCSLYNCFKVQKTDSNVCSGHGSCLNIDECKCELGYYGENCQYFNCSGIEHDNSNVCSSRGECSAPNNCTCETGYTGNDCQYPVCFDIISTNSTVCSGHGSCLDVNNCTCQVTYYGEDCSSFNCFNIINSNQSVCSGRGNCINPDECKCKEGYFGSECQYYNCSGIAFDNVQVCSSRGVCSSPNNCSCVEGYTGNNCQLTSCYGILFTDSKVCSSHGSCGTFNNCTCKSGYFENDCHAFTCNSNLFNDSNVCSGNGNCVQYNDCQCKLGYYGENCQYFNCSGIAHDNSNVCSSRGVCSSPNNCTCESGYYGNNCELTTCYEVSFTDSKVCSGHGSCKSYNNCTCDTGYFGNDCSSYNCFAILNSNSSVCSGYGNCIKPDECKCKEGYYGSECQQFNCSGISFDDSTVCSSRGECLSPSNCSCDIGYTGTDCQFTTCYGTPATDSKVCSGYGSCNSFNNCTCQPGYFENDCHAYTCSAVLYNEAKVCSGKGQCIQYNSCNCSSGYFGNNCETYGCFGYVFDNTKVCSSRGKCSGPNSCSCDKDYFGENCETTTCFNTVSTNSSVCSGRGSCDSFNNCTCQPGYFGNECNLYTCSGVLYNENNVCSGKGSCTSYNECKCMSGYFGNNCETYGCYGYPFDSANVCSSRGTCTSPNSCSCNNGYFDENCQTTTCNNVTSSSSSVCSGHGSCSSFNNCTCQAGYFENDCHAYTCSGVLYNDTAVCSGRGVCTGYNTCSCSSGYYGNNCETFGCFGKQKNDSSVCSGRGECTAKDTCVCKSTNLVKSEGSECEKLLCSDQENRFISASSSKVCSSKGQCTDSGCSCSNGYSGQFCQNFTCYGTPSTDPKVCSGHGSCIDKDTCVCKETSLDGYWSGSSCSSCLPSYDGSDCKHKICDHLTTCNFPKGSCNASLQCECSGNFAGRFCDSCKPNYFGSNCDKYCEKTTNCSSHGECSLDGASCQCFNDSINGYWSDKSCSSCQSGYYGVECSTRVMSSLRFTDSGSGIEFLLNGPSSYTKSNIPCTALLHPSEISTYGSGVKCMWTNKNKLSIVFSGDYSITPYTTVRLNMRMFDSSTKVEYLSFDVLPPLNPTKPTGIISTQRTQFGSCEEISIDGSSSFSGDRKALNFNWTVTPAIPNMDDSLLSQPILVLPSTISPGSYKAELIVKSSFTLATSLPVQLSFVKLEKSLPIVSIVGPSQITTYTNKVPVYVKTLLTLPSCFPNTTALSYDWTLLEGSLNDVEFTKLENGGLVITNFKEKSEKTYLFAVTVSAKQDSSVKTTAQIRMNALEAPFSFIVFTSELTVDSVKVGAELTSPDVDYNSYVWSWECYDPVNQGSCDSNVNSILAAQSANKSTSFTLPKPSGSNTDFDISLKIKQNINTVRVSFPVSVNMVPPVINLLSVSPLTTSLSSKTSLNLQFSVSLQDKEEGIESQIERSWLLNGESIDSTWTPRMNNLLSLSNSIILDLSKLDEGDSYSLSFTVKTLSTQLSTTYIYNFNVVTPPQPCSCSFSPAQGTALDTVFTIKCPNCLSSSSMSLTLGYIDSKTGSKIKLFTSGSEFTTQLPMTSTSALKVFTIVSDSNSNTEAEQVMSVNVVAPTVPLSGIMSKQKVWQKYANSLSANDPRKLVYSSSNINYLVTTLIKSASNSARSILSQVACKNGGELNSALNICKCPTDYKKVDCSMTKSVWDMTSTSRTSLMDFFNSDLDSRIQYEPVDDQFLTYSAIGFETFLSAFDELGEVDVQDKLISDSFTLFKKLLQKSLENKNLVIPTGVELLMKNIMNGYYQYQVWKRSTLNSTTSLDSTVLKQLQQVAVDYSSLLLRSYLLGEEPLTISTDFSHIAVRQVYPIDMSNLVLKYEENTKAIILPSQMIQNIQNVNNRKLMNVQLTSFLNQDLTTRNTTSSNTATITVKSSNSVEFKATNQQLKSTLSSNIDYVINHSNSNNTSTEKLQESTKLDQKTIKNTYRKSTIQCMTIDNDTISKDSQCSVKDSTFSTVTCTCSKQARVMVVEEIEERIEYVSVSQGIVITNGSDGRGYYAFFAILGVVLIAIIIGAVAGIAYYNLKKKKAAASKQDLEMKQV